MITIYVDDWLGFVDEPEGSDPDGPQGDCFECINYKDGVCTCGDKYPPSHYQSGQSHECDGVVWPMVYESDTCPLFSEK